MYRLVCFDLDDTLFDCKTAKINYCKRLLIDNNIKKDFPIDWDRIAEMERKKICRFLLSKFPFPDFTMASLMRDSESRLHEFINIDPALHHLLAAIARDSRVAITSNGSGRLQRKKLASLNINRWISGVFISGEMGCKKPDKAFFEKVLNRSDCKPEETIIIGDDPDTDIIGGINAGLSTCWVSRKRRYPGDLPQPDHIVEDIAGLSTVLNLSRTQPTFFNSTLL